jgi:hypothetical protein
MAKQVVLAEEPQGDQDKGAVWRKDLDKDRIRQIAGSGTSVDLVNILVSPLSMGMRRWQGRNKGSKGKWGRWDQKVVSWDERWSRGFVIEVGEGNKGSHGGDWRGRQRLKVQARQDDDVVQVGNEVVGEVRARG